LQARELHPGGGFGVGVRGLRGGQLRV
jgi:hypothetical protein